MIKNNIESSQMHVKILFTLACLLVLLINGALPFIAMPTLGQAFWSTGFSQSFANDSIFSIHAHNFGAPKPAAMAFGLAGGWVAALFIRLGMHAADAYALMAALWLALAFYGAYKLARFVGVSPRLSILAAFTWGTMPMVWNHAGYSMLSMGIALLPFYFWTALILFEAKADSGACIVNRWIATFLYLVACFIAVFMDGYSFMMFAVGASIVGFFLVVARKSSAWCLIAHCICFLFVYLLYALYIGRGQFEAANLEFFRGWGADISFFLVPSSGVHWVADAMGWSRPRTMNEYFGDGSVWVTTFCLPLALGALIFASATKDTYKIAFVVVAIFGFYMSLGPSFKFYSIKPNPEIPDLMEAKYALAPTGTAILSEKLPGFKNMRASYRWAALGCMGAWMLMVLAMSGRQRKAVTLAAAGTLVTVSVLNLPDLPKKLYGNKSYRNQFMEVDKDLLESMQELLKPGERVAFLPWRNDFLVNYLAAKLNIIAYNVGGDKNYQAARKYWPATLARNPMGGIQDDFSGRVINLLLQGDANAVVLPYIDMLWAAHQWPYPATYRDEIESKIRELERFEYFEIHKRNYYSVVRLKADFSSEESRKRILEAISSSYCMAPVCLQHSGFTATTFSQVGIIEGRKLVTTGKAGFLHFGPYDYLNAGHYLLTVRGTASRANGAWVDVVSQRGKINHGKFVIVPPEGLTDYVLIRAPIHLAEPAQDIEVRVYVEADDRLTLDGYELRPTVQKK